MALLQPQLKQKIKLLQTDDYSKENTFNQDELSHIGTIANDDSAELDDRITAARAMVNITECRLIRAQRQVTSWKRIWSDLEHKRAVDKEVDRTTDMVLKQLGNNEGLENALEALLNLVKDKKASK